MKLPAWLVCAAAGFGATQKSVWCSVDGLGAKVGWFGASKFWFWCGFWFSTLIKEYSLNHSRDPTMIYGIYPLIKEYSLTHNRDPTMIYGIYPLIKECSLNHNLIYGIYRLLRETPLLKS